MNAPKKGREYLESESQKFTKINCSTTKLSKIQINSLKRTYDEGRKRKKKVKLSPSIFFILISSCISSFPEINFQFDSDTNYLKNELFCICPFQEQLINHTTSKFNLTWLYFHFHKWQLLFYTIIAMNKVAVWKNNITVNNMIIINW